MSIQLDEPVAAPAVVPARVLVVDDERSMRELLAIVLKRDGHEVLVAADGRAALELLLPTMFANLCGVPSCRLSSTFSCCSRLRSSSLRTRSRRSFTAFGDLWT